MISGLFFVSDNNESMKKTHAAMADCHSNYKKK